MKYRCIFADIAQAISHTTYLDNPNFDDLVKVTNGSSLQQAAGKTLAVQFNYRWLSRLRIATPRQGKKVYQPIFGGAVGDQGSYTPAKHRWDKKA